MCRRHVAALVEGEDEVTILKVDTSGRQLSLLQRLALPDLALPTAVQVIISVAVDTVALHPQQSLVMLVALCVTTAAQGMPYL